MVKEKSQPLKHIINTSFGILGIEFCWGLLMPNSSAFLLFLGATPAMLAFLWLLPPLVGLIVHPVVGHMSDQTVTRYGRRIPYIFIGVITSCLLCFFIPFVGSLWLGTLILSILMAVLNVAQNPLRALTADVIPEHQLTTGFSVQMVFLGIGAVLGSAMPWLFKNFSAVIPGTHQPPYLTVSFFIGGALALFTGLWTCFKVIEGLPDKNFKKKVSALLGLKQIFVHVFDMPKILMQISIVQFLMWIGFFVLFAYLNLGIAQTLFGLPPGVDIYGDPRYAAIMAKASSYNSLCFVFFQLSGFLIAFTIPILTRWVPGKLLATASLLCGGLGLLSIMIDPVRFYIPASIALGIAWGAVTTVHLTMIATNLPKDRMGLYTGIFPIANCVSQIATGLLLGPIIKYFLNEQVIGVITYSGIPLIIAAVYNQFIKEQSAST